MPSDGYAVYNTVDLERSQKSSPYTLHSLPMDSFEQCFGWVQCWQDRRCHQHMHLPLSDRLEEVEFSNKIQGSGDSANEDSGECVVYLLHPTWASAEERFLHSNSPSMLELAT